MGDRPHESTEAQSTDSGPRRGRALRIAGVSSLVLVVLAGGAAVLWLSTRASEPTRAAASGQRPSVRPPVRLDTLPRPRSADRPRRTRRSPAPAEESDGGGSASRGDDDRASEAAAARAAKRREIAALASEDAELEAALSGDRGPGLGTGEVVSPAPGEVIGRFGRLLGSRHAGIDIDVPTGTPVNAADSGRVAISGVMGGYGKLVCIQHTGTLSTCYAHNSRLRVEEGDSVDFGEVIATSGCSGRCYEPHLHFEVRDRGEAVNPKDYL